MTNSSTLAGRKLVQVALTVKDLDRARIFYRDTLGLPLMFEAGNMLFFDIGGQRLMVGLLRTPTGRSSVALTSISMRPIFRR